MEVFGATSDPPKHRGDVEEIDQAKRYLSKPEPAWLIARSRSNNQPCRPGLDRSQDENPAEIQVQTAINQILFQARQGRCVMWIDRMPSVRVSD